MIASRLLRIALDFCDDYEKMNVEQLLSSAAQLCAERSIHIPTYQNKSQEIRNTADRIINNTKFRAYPPIYIDTLMQSDFYDFLPEKIASFVMNGLTGNPATTVSSGELNTIAQSAINAVHEMRNLSKSLIRMGVEEISIPDNHISVEFYLPRSIIDNKVIGYLDENKRVNKILTALLEYVDDGYEGTDLVFTSTSDPIIAYGVTASAAYGVIKLVNGLLDIAKKSVELYSAIKTLRDSGISDGADALKEKSETFSKKEMEILVNNVTDTLSGSVSVERKYEIIIAIQLQCEALLPIIADGATISLSPENSNRVNELKPKLAIVESPTLQEIQRDNNKKFHELEAAVKLKGGHGLQRITHDTEN